MARARVLLLVLLVVAAALAAVAVTVVEESTPMWSLTPEAEPKGQEPVYVHTAFAGADGSSAMWVTWTTKKPTEHSQVRLFDPSGVMYRVINGTEPQQTYDPNAGYSHYVRVDSLAPDTAYSFDVGDPHGGYSAQKYRFRTAPRAGYQKPFTVAMLADMGLVNSNYTRQRLTQLAVNDEIDWILLAGDLSYADDSPGAFYVPIYHEFLHQTQEMLGHKSMMTTPGNHDIGCRLFPCLHTITNFTSYNTLWKMPSEDSGSEANMWWSIQYQNIHYVGISTETDFPNAPYAPKFGDQLDWLERDLAKAKANPTVDWIIVAGHRPIYSSRQGLEKNNVPQTYCADIQKSFEALFHTYGVDLYMCGHLHSYERMWPTYQNVPVKHLVNPGATVHITNGAAGCVEGYTRQWEPKPDWSAYRADSGELADKSHHGFALLDVPQRNQLHWRYFLSEENKVIDEFTLEKDLSHKPPVHGLNDRRRRFHVRPVHDHEE